MTCQEAITTGEAARRLSRYPHQLRRLLDALEKEGRLRVVRLGAARAVAVSDLPMLAEELEKRKGWARLESATA
jgi:hypothetical protein